MKQLKLALVAAAATAFACATNTPTNITVNSGRTEVVNADSAPAPAGSPAADQHAAARATYGQFCANCHKPNGEGGVAVLDEGTKLNVPSFRTQHSLEHTDEQFERKIMNGDRDEGMPAFKGRLSPEQIDGLVRLIRQDFQAAGATAAPAAGHANANAGGH